MKIAVISDIHDNLVNLEKCFDWCRQEKINELICPGDLTNEETLKYLAENFSGRTFLVRGNADSWDEGLVENFKNISYFGARGGAANLGGRKIGLGHKLESVDNLLENDKFDIVFYGHTHKPWESLKNGIKLINPGALGGMFVKATFAVYDSEKNEAELKILEML